ncbi:MAG: hypothetical protein J7L53_09390 [Deltaproteobacteria bacterium]|nr:hypothetical protein [Deltaproteobacteria bacterium]
MKVGLGKKAKNTPIDILIYQNMNVQVYRQRMAMQEIDFTNIIRLMKEYNKDKEPRNKLRLPAILMKAIAIAYDYEDENGYKPYRRFSGYVSSLPWGGSWESDTIDISMIIVREIAGEKDQSCPIVFNELEKHNVLELSRKIWDMINLPEDEIDQIRFLKKMASLPPIIVYFLLKLTKIPWIRARVMAPTSLAVIARDVKWFQGEHTSYFGLPAIDKRTNKAHLEWTYDHRLGMGKDIAGFFALLKNILESGEFLREEIEGYSSKKC